MHTRPRATPTLALLAFLAACTGDTWRALDAQLQAASAETRRAGFAPPSGPYNDFGSFTDSLVRAWPVALDSGTAYVVGAVCSEHCTALDAAVAAPGGAALVADTTAAPAPFVAFTAPAAGRYTVRLSGRCRGTCWWVAQVYARGVGGLRPGFAGGEH